MKILATINLCKLPNGTNYISKRSSALSVDDRQTAFGIWKESHH